MILIIGGFAQGKLHYVEQHYVQREDRQEVPVLDGTLRLASDSKITWAKPPIINIISLSPFKCASAPLYPAIHFTLSASYVLRLLPQPPRILRKTSQNTPPYLR